MKSYDESLNLFREIGNHLNAANVLKSMGDVQQFRDEQTALNNYNEALDLFRGVNNRLGEANVLKAMGDIQSL